MSRSRKDGRRGGGHRNTQMREYWSRRPCSMWTPSKSTKRIVHGIERAQTRRIEYAALRDREVL